MTVLLTGASGFIGSSINQAAHAKGMAVRALHRQPRGLQGEMCGDLLMDDATPFVAGVDSVVHTASRTSGSEAEVWAANVDATKNLVRAAAKHGIPVLYVSTTGVYGHSAGWFGDPATMTRSPSSALSQARAAAEDIVLQAGGTVLRPHVVYGVGDRWVVPPLVELMQRAHAWIGEPDIHVAAIDVNRLAAAVLGVLGKAAPPVMHAAEPGPVSIRDLVAPVFHARGREVPTESVSVDAAHALVKRLGVSRNALQMVGANSAMDSSPLWRICDQSLSLPSKTSVKVV